MWPGHCRAGPVPSAGVHQLGPGSLAHPGVLILKWASRVTKGVNIGFMAIRRTAASMKFWPSCHVFTGVRHPWLSLCLALNAVEEAVCVGRASNWPLDPRRSYPARFHSRNPFAAQAMTNASQASHGIPSLRECNAATHAANPVSTRP